MIEFIKNCWQKFLWYAWKLLILIKVKKPIRIPALKNGNIDTERVTYVALTIMNGSKVLMLLIDGQAVWLQATTEMLDWIEKSGITIDDKSTMESIYEFTNEEIEDSKDFASVKHI